MSPATTVLTHGRRPGEIVPLATLTHELGGGADWPMVEPARWIEDSAAPAVRRLAELG
jgi:hypothetical protein